MIADEEARQIVEDVISLESSRIFLNQVSQAHSRSILRKLRTPPDTWPRYTLSDENLHYTAHYLFWQGLQLRDLPEYRGQGNRYIMLGSEILEFLYSSLQRGSADRTDQLFNAALGYYISGYFARAYVLMRDIETEVELPLELELLRRLFEKDMVGMRQLIARVLEAEQFSDTRIAAELRFGTLPQDEALDRILHASLYRAFSYFVEYPKTGYQPLFDQAMHLVDRGIELALRTGFVDWWWLFYCTRHLFDEFGSSALWNVLAPMGGDDPEKRYVEPYIRANFVRPVPVTELWPSQMKAVPFINEPARGSYCLKMPTSAGKTKIAELAILRFLLDHQDDSATKCLYIAPFRSLAVEVEASFKKSFHPLGVRVSEIYGGFDLNPIDQLMMEETRIIIATPEKIDAFLRYNPKLASQVRLVIVDEGHIISLSDRGIRYEFFLHRLALRFSHKGVRTLFMSAVLPNMDEFARWIVGESSSVISEQWRPSRLLVGELRWNGSAARIDYLQANHKALGHECFVPSFIRPVEPKGLPDIRYRKRFPNDIAEVVADAGVQFARQGTTMIFCTRKVSADPMAQSVLRSIRINTALARRDGRTFSLSVDAKGRNLLEQCIQLAKEYMGEDNKLIEYLRAGFVLHHADIPKPVRIRLEELVRSGSVSLVIATTTLAQGVNLPIQTVIVHGLSHGYDQQLTPVTFWNICGRAGRGMYENEGQVLFAVDLDLPNVQLDNTDDLTDEQIKTKVAYKRKKRIEKEAKLREGIIKGYDRYWLKSAVRELLFKIVQSWEVAHNELNVAELCLRLAQNDLRWLSDQDRLDVEKWLGILDTELLALVEETEQDVVAPDVLQLLMEGSLLFLQSERVQGSDITNDVLASILFARWNHVNAALKGNADRRRRFYKLGFSLRDCREIEEHERDLLAILMRANNYETWSSQKRCDYLVLLMGHLLDYVAEIAPKDSPVHGCWPRVMTRWLLGDSPNEIASDPVVSACSQSPAEVSSYIEDTLVYKLPWGLNAVSAYLVDMVEQTGVDLPREIAYFPALLRYGVHDPNAACLLAFGLESRKLALKLVSIYPGGTISPSAIRRWFLEVATDDLVAFGFNRGEIQQLEEVQENVASLKQGRAVQPDTLLLSIPNVSNHSIADLTSGDMLLLRPEPDVSPRTFSLKTLWGTHIGTYRYPSALPSGWGDSERLTAQVRNMEKTDEQHATLSVQVTVLG